MKTLLFICMALGYAASLNAQHEGKEIRLLGIVVDAYTLHPLPFAHITKNHRQSVATDENGRFRIEIEPRDTIEITYVGYQTRALSSQEKQEKYVIVSLEPAISILQEVEVRFMPTEQTFKNILFSLNPTKNEMHARNNIRLIQLYVEAIPAPEDDPFFNHPHLAASSSFTFFSSKGQQGITRFIKSTRVMNSPNTYFNKEPDNKEPDNDQFIEVKLTEQPDSLKQDPLVTKKSLKQK